MSLVDILEFLNIKLLRVSENTNFDAENLHQLKTIGSQPLGMPQHMMRMTHG
jgi:hypothetical protein